MCSVITLYIIHVQFVISHLYLSCFTAAYSVERELMKLYECTNEQMNALQYLIFHLSATKSQLKMTDRLK